MGLRAKLGLLLLACFVGLAAVSAQWLHIRLISHYEELERTEASQAMVRLLRTIEAQVAMVNRTTEEWSNWTEMHTFMAERTPGFVEENLSTDSLKTSRLTALQLRDVHGRQVEIAEIPGTDGRHWISDFTRSGSPLYEGYLQRFTAESPPFCGIGIVTAQHPILLLCDQAIVKSGGKSASNGRLLAARVLDNATIAEIAAITQLQFRIALFDQPGKVFDGAPAVDLAPMTLMGMKHTPQLSMGASAITVAFPLHGLVTSRLYGWLYLDYPREHFDRIKQQAVHTAALLVAMILITTVLMILAIDRLVVRRLLKLQREVESATRGIDWNQRVSGSGEDELGSLAARVNALLDMIQQQVEQLSVLTLTDTLTGLPNRRAFDQRMALALKRHQREHEPLALLIIDVDNFKKFNDRYGHPAGDDTLRQVATALQGATQRGTDLVARIGGEEFAVVLEATDSPGALALATRALAAVQALAIRHDGNPPGIATVSIGLALLEEGDDADRLYHRADACLYQAKHDGRNRIVVSHPA